jgi:hypothetical protein
LRVGDHWSGDAGLSGGQVGADEPHDRGLRNARRSMSTPLPIGRSSVAAFIVVTARDSM